MADIPRMTEEQMDQFPWGGFPVYAKEHPEIRPDFSVPALTIVDAFEAELIEHGRGAVLARGISGTGKSTILVPAVERTLIAREYATVPGIKPDFAEELLAEGRIPDAEKGRVMVLDEFCNGVLEYHTSQPVEETFAEYTRELVETVGLLKPAGIICIDAKTHDVVRQIMPEKPTVHEATRRALTEAMRVPISELDIPLEEATPSPQAVEDLLNALGVDPEITARFAANAALRTVELLGHLTSNIGWKRKRGGSGFTLGNEIVDETRLEPMLRVPANGDKYSSVWYGFKTEEIFIAHALGRPIPEPKGVNGV